MSQESKEMNCYLPVLAGITFAIGSEVTLILFDKLLRKTGACSSQFPWYINVLPLVFLIGGAVCSGRMLWQRRHELLE